MAATQGREDYLLKKRLSKKFAEIRRIGWTTRSIRNCIKLADTTEKRDKLLKVVDIIIMCKLREYDSNEKGETLLEIFKGSPKSWEKNVYHLAMFQLFPGTYVKPLEELTAEINELNNNDLSRFILQQGKLKEVYDQVVSAYKNPSSLPDFLHSGEMPDFLHSGEMPDFLHSGEIKFWTKHTIRAWAEQVKTDETAGRTVNMQEKIAVIKRAVEIATDFEPRDAQLLSLITLLNTEKEKGRLIQINTGEGKTIIIAMFAAIKALEGHTVDVITTSPELARPHAEEQKKFFSLFGLSAAYIEDKQAYKADILYGDAMTFQGDILKDEYLKMNVRQKRPFDIGIVDEVDSMLIDGKDNIVKLSSPMPGFNQLEPVLAVIWKYVRYAADKIIEEDGNTYVLEQIYEENNQETTYREERILLNCSKVEYIKIYLEKQLRIVLQDTQNLPESEFSMLDKYPKIEIPNHLRKFVTKCQLKKWIDNGIKAKYYCENKKDYIVKNQKIAPVDAKNTGVVQLNMLWADALHQFLQLKHGAKLSAENLTTNYISNVTFFKRYGDKLYGLTGTLGSTEARKVLGDTYGVDSIIIPPYQKTQFLEFEPVITESEEDWYQNIVRTSLIHLRNGRPVLIITKYIKEADKIFDMFTKDFGYDKNKVKKYQTEEDSAVIKDKLEPGTVIIATNIAGRGTDLKLSAKAEENGGLHVCGTFLPVNQRVEKQNVGRTSRKGCKGTAQFILLERQAYSLTDLRRQRDAIEIQTLRTAKCEIQKVILRDKIFKEFCKLLDEVNQTTPPDDMVTKISNVKDNIENQQDRSISHSATEERFAIWLKENNEMLETKDDETVCQNYESFKKEILDDAKTGCLVKNPYYYILEGNRLLDTKNYTKAIDLYTKAIKMDTNVYLAYYYRAYACIAKYGNDPKKHHDEIQTAREDLQEAKRIITCILEPMLLLIGSESKGEALTEQINHKFMLLHILKLTIDNVIGPNYHELIEQLESEKAVDGKTSDEIKFLEEKIEEYREKKEKNEGGLIDEVTRANKAIKIELRDIKDFLRGEDENTYKDEIEEFNYNGLHGCIVAQGKNNIQWLPVVGYLAIGITLCVGGVAACLLAEGAAAYFGYAVVFEGLSDLVITAKDGIFGKGVSFKHWVMGKAVFVLVSIATFGLSAIATTAKTVGSALRQVTTGLTESVKNGWKTAFKTLGVSAATKIGQETLNYVSNIITVEHILPSIQGKIFNSIYDKIRDFFANDNRIQRAIAHDARNRNMRCQTLILDEVDNMLFPVQCEKHWLWDVYTVIKNSVVGTLSYYFKSGADLLTLAVLTNLIREISSLAPTQFIRSLNRKLDEGRVDELINHNTEETPAPVQTLEPTDYTNAIADGDIDLKLGKEPQEQVVLDRNTQQDYLAEKVSKKLSAKMAELVYVEAIVPFNYRATGYVTNQLFSSLNEMVNEDIFHYQRERKVTIFKERYMSHDNGSQFEDELQVYVTTASNVIERLENDESMDFYILQPLSVAIDRPIVIMNEGKIVQITGDTFSGTPVCIEYRQEENQGIGFWTIPGKNEGQNSLFGVVAEQLGTDYAEIKGSAISVMKNNLRDVAKRVKDAEVLDFFCENVLMMGVAN